MRKVNSPASTWSSMAKWGTISKVCFRSKWGVSLRGAPSTPLRYAHLCLRHWRRQDRLQRRSNLFFGQDCFARLAMTGFLLNKAKGSDLARQLLLKRYQLFFQNTKVLCLRMVEDECRNRRFRFHHKPFG